MKSINFKVFVKMRTTLRTATLNIIHIIFKTNRLRCNTQSCKTYKIRDWIIGSRFCFYKTYIQRFNYNLFFMLSNTFYNLCLMHIFVLLYISLPFAPRVSDLPDLHVSVVLYFLFRNSIYACLIT